MSGPTTTPPDQSGTDRVCPFCPLHCDDLEIQAGKPVSGACTLALGLAGAALPTSATIAGKSVDRADALLEAARILNASKAPLISGLAADVEGMRGTIAIADRLGAVVDHANSTGFFANLDVMQRRGALNTTPAEVRNRADVAVLIGSDFWTRLPRFFERYFPAGPTLFDPNPKPRKIFVISGDGAAPTIAGADVVGLKADLSAAQELAFGLTALAAGRPIKAASVAGLALTDAAKIADALKSATYGVIGWEAGQFGPHGDLAIEALYDLIQVLNQSTRAAGLPFPGGGHVIGAHQVILWQAGTALRTSFASGKPAYDPRLYALNRQLEDRRVDAALWVAAMPGAELPKLGIPTVLVSAFPPPDGVTPDVFIPVSIPARDHAAILFRGEGVVSVHAEPWGAAGALPSVKKTLDALIDLLTEREIPAC